MSQGSTITQPTATVFGIGTDVWGGVIRHLITAAAGALAAHGVLASSSVSDVTMQLGVALGLQLLTTGWSWWQKRATR